MTVGCPSMSFVTVRYLILLMTINDPVLESDIVCVRSGGVVMAKEIVFFKNVADSARV